MFGGGSNLRILTILNCSTISRDFFFKHLSFSSFPSCFAALGPCHENLSAKFELSFLYHHYFASLFRIRKSFSLTIAKLLSAILFGFVALNCTCVVATRGLIGTQLKTTKHLTVLSL